jgi:hypothetical protein
MTRWNIAFADREYARVQGDPDLGTVTADTQEQALELARKDAEITRRASGHMASLWAYRARDEQAEHQR